MSPCARRQECRAHFGLMPAWAGAGNLPFYRQIHRAYRLSLQFARLNTRNGGREPTFEAPVVNDDLNPGSCCLIIGGYRACLINMLPRRGGLLREGGVEGGGRHLCVERCRLAPTLHIVG